MILGSITVRVLDGSAHRNGHMVPISGASVTLSGGMAGTTDVNGEITWNGLPLGEYTASATAENPLTGGDPRSGSGSASLTRTQRNGVIEIVLRWDSAGQILGRICLPRAPGATVTATHASGATASTFIPATGRLGRWVEYSLDGLEPGTWELTLRSPGEAPASQTIRVAAGEAVRAGDFTLACTGENPHKGFPQTPLLVAGGLLLALGAVLRRRQQA